MALRKLLGDGQREFSQKGVYAYWNPETHEILYLGLASDLPGRFAQHNGLVSHSGGNKRDAIETFFAEHGKLGLTVLVQSAAIQVLEEVGRLDFTLGASSRDLISVGEGQLIEMHRLAYGRWPAWNRTGGSSQGKRWATSAPGLLEVLGAQRPSLFAAREPLRRLTGSFKLMLFESTIHAARLRAVQDAFEIGHPLPPEPSARLERIERTLMLRDGSLVQELDATDDVIELWLKRLGDPQHWIDEANLWQREFADVPLDAQGQAVLNLLDSYMADAVPEQHQLATAEIFSSDYLKKSPFDRA